MERLTYRTKDGWVGVNNLDDKSVSPTSVAIHKLAYIEDFMEEQGFESFEHLKDELSGLKAGYDFVWEQGTDAIKELIQENQKGKDNWQELRKYVEKYADNFDEAVASVCDLILMKMQELEKDD